MQKVSVSFLHIPKTTPYLFILTFDFYIKHRLIYRQERHEHTHSLIQQFLTESLQNTHQFFTCQKYTRES